MQMWKELNVKGPSNVCMCVCVCPTDDEALKVGDVLLQVQDLNVQDMTRFEAWNLIKSLPEGPVTVVIGRKAAPTE